MNIIVDYELKRYVPFLKGLVLYIESSSQKRKVRKLRPVNITYLPRGLKKKIIERLDAQMALMAENLPPKDVNSKV